jgi:acyl carrier protein
MYRTPSADIANIRDSVRSFIVDNFLFGIDEINFTDNISFLKAGIVDSTGILEIVNFIESEYHIRVDDRDVLPENLDSLSNIVAYVKRRLADDSS